MPVPDDPWPHMPTMAPPIEYRVGQPAEPITAESPQWSAPLPLQRQALHGRQTLKPPPAAITYGDYFSAVCDFLTREGMAGLGHLAARAGQRPVQPAHIQRITIHLIKHGAFYHPALVTLHTDSQDLSLILNVAVSQTGRQVLPVEHRQLELLSRRFPRSFLPKVYGRGRGADATGRQLEMFAAQWLSDFHELHPSTGPADEAHWTVWDTVRGPWRLSPSQVSAFHEQAAFILTYYYNPLTFEAILDWHHAAGDFVIRRDQESIIVRLITVRRYAPMFALEDETQPDLQAVLDGLVIFLLNTSLHLRLDRLDGTGELVWAPDHVLPAIWQGFRRGLERMAPLYHLPPEFIEAVRQYLAAHGSEGMTRVIAQVIENHARQGDGADLLSRQGPAHAAGLARVIRDTV